MKQMFATLTSKAKLPNTIETSQGPVRRALLKRFRSLVSKDLTKCVQHPKEAHLGVSVLGVAQGNEPKGNPKPNRGATCPKPSHPVRTQLGHRAAWAVRGSSPVQSHTWKPARCRSDTSRSCETHGIPSGYLRMPENCKQSHHKPWGIYRVAYGFPSKPTTTQFCYVLLRAPRCLKTG